VSELNFEDLPKINTIKKYTYEKEKEDMVKRQMDALENVRNTDRTKKYEDKFEKEKKVKIRQ
jgi:hypothetical protein